MNTENVIYTAKTHTTGGRDGASRSSDGRLDIKHSSPGGPGQGTNPEQLFAAGWSACFEGAMAGAARSMQVKLPDDLAIDAEVDLCRLEGAYSLQARLNVSLPGLDPDTRSRHCRCGSSDLSLFEGNQGQHRCRNQPGRCIGCDRTGTDLNI